MTAGATRRLATVMSLLVAASFVIPARADDGRDLLAQAHALQHLLDRVRGTRAASSIATVPYLDEVERAARRYALPCPLILAVIAVESAFDPSAMSPKGARGLMQVMPKTALKLGVNPDLLFAPGINIETGTRYLRELADRYRGHTVTVLAAYNAGPARVDSQARLPRETTNYLRRVRAAYPYYAEILEKQCRANERSDQR